MAIVDPTFDLHTALTHALAIAKKRIAWCKLATPCPNCGTDQVQLYDWLGEEPEWKCRRCKTEWKGV